MKLTEGFIRNIEGTGKVQKHSDGRGLFLYVTPDGKKYWRMAYRFESKQKLLSIGQYPLITLREARVKREEARRLLQTGVDPSINKQESKTAIVEASKNSFEIVAREWLEQYFAQCVTRTKSAILKRLEKYLFPSLGKRPIKEIKAPELFVMIRRVEEEGSLNLAHHLLQDCGRIFRYAIVTKRAERDVASDLRGALASHTKKHYARITTSKELAELLLALDTPLSHFSVQSALRLAPFVFVRASEMAKAEWSEIDFEKAEWRIPAERMKMKQVHIVPLAEQSLKILRDLHALTGRGTYLFPVKQNQKLQEKPISSTSLVARIRSLGYDKDSMTFHGFRSIASTHLNELGYNTDWIERQLAHCERNGVRAAYNYAQYLPERRKMMQEWADYLTRIKNE